MFKGSRTLRASRDVNEFRLILDPDLPSRALLTFDYLDRRDGAVFEIIHTGAKGKARVTGSVRGIPKGVSNWGGLLNWETQKSSVSDVWPIVIMMAIFLIPLLLGQWLQSILTKKHPTAASAIGYASYSPLVLFGIVLCVAAILALGYTVRTFWRRLPISLSHRT